MAWCPRNIASRARKSVSQPPHKKTLCRHAALCQHNPAGAHPEALHLQRPAASARAARHGLAGGGAVRQKEILLGHRPLVFGHAARGLRDQRHQPRGRRGAHSHPGAAAVLAVDCRLLRLHARRSLSRRAALGAEAREREPHSVQLAVRGRQAAHRPAGAVAQLRGGQEGLHHQRGLGLLHRLQRAARRQAAARPAGPLHQRGAARQLPSAHRQVLRPRARDAFRRRTGSRVRPRASSTP